MVYINAFELENGVAMSLRRAFFPIANYYLFIIEAVCLLLLCSLHNSMTKLNRFSLGIFS